MNKHLESAVSRDTRKQEFKIMPISKIDGEIWQELLIAIGRSGNQELFDIINRYKLVADKDIAEDLLAYNTNNPEIGEEEDHKLKFPPTPILSIKDIQIQIYHILKLSQHDRYDNNVGGMVYDLIINEDISNKVIFSNTTITYFTAESRRLDIERINKQFEENGYKILTNGD